MSTWKWKYDPEVCDHGICVGDCDVCDREDDEIKNDITVDELWKKFFKIARSKKKNARNNKE